MNTKGHLTSSRKIQHGFTLVELLVVVSIIALLIALLLPALSRARELANRAVCSANVRSIIQSMIIYAQSNKNQFPAVPGSGWGGYANSNWWPNSGYGGTATAQEEAQAWFTPTNSPASAPCPLACLWLMVLNGQMNPASFICPSDPITKTPSAEYFPVTGGGLAANGDFGGARGLNASNYPVDGRGESYSIADPWPNNDIWPNSGQGGWWTGNVGGDVPIVSDMAPMQDANAAGTLERLPATLLAGNTYGNYIYNSGNHNGDGQNVGFGDGHVAWELNPYCGQNGDNIFTYDTSGAPSSTNTNQVAVTQTITDTVLIKTLTPPYDVCMVPARDVATGQW